MKKKYLTIEIEDKEGIKTKLDAFLLTDNVTGFISVIVEGNTRLYFKNANPFSYILVHLTGADFLNLVKGFKTFTIEKEGSRFVYSITEF